ncbi:hypothetical protein BFL43_22180 [Williamsia sp. 1135]|nr:hypothetical protein BFL43_22180 [Williamsia sp. 1135]
MMLNLPGAGERVAGLIAADLVVASPRPDRERTYAVDTRDSVSPVFRLTVIEAIDRIRDADGELRIAAVANSGSLLCALWAGATGRPFWNVLVDGRRTRGFGRNVEPAEGVRGRKFVLVDNHARTGTSLRTAMGIIQSHGGFIASAMVFTAGDRVDFDPPLYVALPHNLIVDQLSKARPRGPQKVRPGADTL